MFVGLWVVPRYVPMSELGAALPLMGIGGVIGFPLSVITLPLLRFTAVFRERGEIGKAKALIRDTLIGVVVFALLSLAIAAALMPAFFRWMRVESGSLAILILASTVFGSVSGVFGSAVQGLRLFSASILFMAIAAPLRLALMVVLMPLRALSGYIVGQNANAIVGFFGSAFVVRRFFRNSAPAEPYWKEYGREIIRYTWPLALMTLVTTFASNLDSIVIRYRLSEFESAGFYIVTRFADLSNYLGSAFMMFLVPMLAERQAGDGESRKILSQAMIGTVGTGVAVVAALALGGGALLSLRQDWAVYSSLVPEMVTLSANTTLTMGILCLTGAFTAQARMRFLWHYLPLLAAKSIFIFAITGYFDRLIVVAVSQLSFHAVIFALLIREAKANFSR